MNLCLLSVWMTDHISSIICHYLPGFYTNTKVYCMVTEAHMYDVCQRYLQSDVMQILPFSKPPPPVGAGGGYMFSGRPCRCPSVRDSHGSFMFPRCLQYLLTDFRHFCHWCILGHRWPDYVSGSKCQSSRLHHRGGGAQHSTLPSSATFSSSLPKMHVTTAGLGG